jgi:hypothetical protein
MEININMNEFSNIEKLLVKTTAVDKPMTFAVQYNNQKSVVKRVRNKKNAVDIIIVNEIKKYFNLNQVPNIRFFKSNYDISAKNNRVFRNKNDVIKYFIISDFIEESSMLSEDIDVLANEDLLYEYVKCALYRGLFQVNDFCSRNVLIANSQLYSIDENGVGSQFEIIKKRDINSYIKNGINIEIINDLIHNFKICYDHFEDDINEYLTDCERIEYINLLVVNLRNLKKNICRDLNIEI